MSEKEVLESEGFKNVYSWHDEPGTQYNSHAHKGKVSMFITQGSVTFNLNGSKHVVKSGERFDVPVGVEHTAEVGPNGCDYVVGEMIPGDTD